MYYIYVFIVVGAHGDQETTSESWFPPSTWGLNLGCQMWWWVPVCLTEASRWPGNVYTWEIAPSQQEGDKNFPFYKVIDREDKSKHYKKKDYFPGPADVICFPLQMFSITSFKISSRYSMFDYLELIPQCLNFNNGQEKCKRKMTIILSELLFSLYNIE